MAARHLRGAQAALASMTAPPLPRFLRLRWQGQIGVSHLFWVDLLSVATVLNLFVGFASLMILAQRADWWWVVALHALILPYNFFLAASVWRHPRAGGFMKLVSGLWCVGMLAL